MNSIQSFSSMLLTDTDSSEQKSRVQGVECNMPEIFENIPCSMSNLVIWHLALKTNTYVY